MTMEGRAMWTEFNCWKGGVDLDRCLTQIRATIKEGDDANTLAELEAVHIDIESAYEQLGGVLHDLVDFVDDDLTPIFQYLYTDIPTQSFIYLKQMVVNPSHRRQGLGTMLLMDIAMTWPRHELVLQPVPLEAEDDELEHQKLIRWYEGRGFHLRRYPKQKGILMVSPGYDSDWLKPDERDVSL